MLFFLLFRRSVENGRRNFSGDAASLTIIILKMEENYSSINMIHDSEKETYGKTLTVHVYIEPSSVRMQGVIFSRTLQCFAEGRQLS